MSRYLNEIVINATRVSADNTARCYEFVLNEALNVVACGYVDSVGSELINVIENYNKELKGVLFELNHVRINPKMDNAFILERFMQEVAKSGVPIRNVPPPDSIKVCYQPIGKLEDVVRFYLTAQNKLVFLSPSVKLHVVDS